MNSTDPCCQPDQATTGFHRVTIMAIALETMIEHRYRKAN